MKKIYQQVLWILMLLPLVVMAKEYDAGVDYEVLSHPVKTQTGDKVEVLEFFWYGCPHCFKFEPTLSAWVKKLPSNVKFIRIPAPLNPKWMVHTKTYYALEMMGKGEQYHEALFNAIHIDRKRLFTKDKIADFLASKGVDKKLFLDTMNSFGVEMRARKAAQLSREYNLHGVPMLAVNGKYIVTGEKAGSFKNMVDIASYLIKKESR